MSNEKVYTVPAAVLTERPEDYELRVTLPGIAKDEVELHLEGRTLTLRTASKYQAPAGFRAVATEFERADYAMSADLPELAEASTLAAKLENGILVVTIRKRPETQPRRIAIA